ncbi:MAG: transglycosylase SLT domain-containing protein [Litorimonas sp.]
MRSFCLACLFAVGTSLLPVSASLAAAAPTPRLKPAPPALSQYLSQQDALLLRRGLSAAQDEDWSDLVAAKTALSDPVARDILHWIRSARDPNVPTGWLDYAVRNLQGWPQGVTIAAKAEREMFDDPRPPSETLSWFASREPVSGEGRAALARAHYRLGDAVKGDEWLKKAWRESRLTRDRQRDLFGEYRARLTEADHAARADHLIWLGRSHFAKAEALLPHMSASDRAVMTARMRLSRNSRVNDAVAGVPADRLDDPAFLFERARWRRLRRSNDYALPTQLEVNSPVSDTRGQSRIWTERRLMAFWLIAEKNWPDAYRMTQHIGATSGPAFFEAEFMAGWLALTKLQQATASLDYFKRLEEGVATPISLARAHYWQGRAHEALADGQKDVAYAKAAAFPNTYYGQLAAKRLHGTNARITLPPQTVSAEAKARFVADRRVRALHLLGEAGAERYFSTLSYALDDQLESLDELALLSELAADYGFMRPSVRAAKQAGRLQSMLTDAGYPLVDAIEALGPEFDIPFVYAIARQESEFAGTATSSARAYGMMQMIEPTARATARRHRVPYSRDRLNSDRDYAARLGALHIHDLLEDYDGSYILAAVGYNAGPTRVRQWIERNGDPRSGQIDPVDWVEKIPFSETRNYVMRVMENMQVYKARRNGNTAPVTLDQALRFGSQHPAIR